MVPDNRDFEQSNSSGSSSGYYSEWDKWKQRFSQFGGKLGWVIILAIIALYAVQGIYQVQPAEVGLVKRFGRHIRTTKSGLHYHLPAPIETVNLVDKRSIRKIEIGYKTVSPPPNPQYVTNKQEALMLTGDNNIVHLELAVQYTVSDAIQYAFNLMDPKALIEETAEAVIRQEVVQHTIDEVLTVQRAEIAMDAENALQDLMNQYKAGIRIEAVKIQDAKPPKPVIPAFNNVTSAKEDKKRYVNEAEAYANEVIPKANGKAAEIRNQAKAYKEEHINAAKGEVSRFLQVLKQYQLGNQAITRKRLYIETMETILPSMKKVILTDTTDGSSVLKLLDLNKLKGGNQ